MRWRRCARRFRPYVKRLANSREARIVIGGDADVVETKQPKTSSGTRRFSVAKGADRADGRDVVKRDDGREAVAMAQAVAAPPVAELWGGQVLFQLNG